MAPQVPAVEADRALIQGVTLTSQAAPEEPPIILVEAREKAGKSSLSTTLFDWPEPGDRPLVLAFDRTGPDSCAQLGFAVPALKIQNQPGANVVEQGYNVLANLEDVYRAKGKKPYSTIVVDCASTQAELYWHLTKDLKDARQRYGKVLDWCVEFMNRLYDLGVPLIYYSWLKESWVEEIGSGQNKSKKIHMGGPEIRGSFKAKLGGRAQMIFLMEKTKALGNDPESSSDGYKRTFRTKTVDMIEAGGRYRLPDPMPANLGYALAMITGMIENPSTRNLEIKK